MMSIPCRVPRGQGSRQDRARIHTLPRALQFWTSPPCQGGLQRCHVSSSFGPRHPTEVGSGTAMYLVATDLTLLQTGTVATGRKPLWPRAATPSLLLRRYSGSTVATGRSCPSLLWSVATMSTVTLGAHRYCGMW
jgi:hypothetical protein